MKMRPIVKPDVNNRSLPGGGPGGYTLIEVALGQHSYCIYFKKLTKDNRVLWHFLPMHPEQTEMVALVLGRPDRRQRQAAQKQQAGQQTAQQTAQ